MVNEKAGKKLHLFKKGKPETLKPDIFVYFCKKQLIFKELASSTKNLSKNI